MGEFFKRCGIGLVVIVASPLWLAYYLCYVVYGLLLLLFAPVRVIIYAIQHKKMDIQSEYDLKAEALLKATPAQVYPNQPAANANGIPPYMFSNSPTASFQAQNPNYPYQNPVPYQQPSQPYPQQAYPYQGQAYQPNPYGYPNQVPPQQPYQQPAYPYQAQAPVPDYQANQPQNASDYQQPLPDSGVYQTVPDTAPAAGENTDQNSSAQPAPPTAAANPTNDQGGTL
jgi:hypothetical protein